MTQILCTRDFLDEILLLTLKLHSNCPWRFLRREAVVAAPQAQCQALSTGTIISCLPEELCFPSQHPLHFTLSPLWCLLIRPS